MEFLHSQFLETEPYHNQKIYFSKMLTLKSRGANENSERCIWNGDFFDIRHRNMAIGCYHYSSEPDGTCRRRKIHQPHIDMLPYFPQGDFQK